MNSKTEKLNSLTHEWFSRQPLKPERQKKLDKKFRLEFNYNSNHLEGNTLTFGETQRLLLLDQTKGEHDFRNYEEMKAHDVALKKIIEVAADKEFILSEGFIRDLNKIILVRPFWKDAITYDGEKTRKEVKIGEYKEHPNSVIQKNGEVFEYASPFETPMLMQDLITWYREHQEKNELQPIELATLLHYKYIIIHPFDDGNGRIARLLVNYVMYKNNLPPIVIKSDDKKNYFRALQAADAGFIEDFLDYMQEQLIWSLEIGIKAAKGENIEDEENFEERILIHSRNNCKK
ncbi:MAG: Fic family protein [Firmicutes bacterium]|nr:Fic family protein [Bacillota bacterium]